VDNGSSVERNVILIDDPQHQAKSSSPTQSQLQAKSLSTEPSNVKALQGETLEEFRRSVKKAELPT
ncbi:hypothetical protein A2U01_0117031, partial [Trifolium medium]|nr:hypothetical protein [Trifolium medium]